MDININPINTKDRPWIVKLLTENWFSSIVISRGKRYDASILPGFVAKYQGSVVGLVTYLIEYHECQIITLDSWLENIGVGSALINAVRLEALQTGCSRMWMITTNDNLKALKFYQKRGFQLVAVYPNALTESRRIKPSIPDIGKHGIPLRDEIELQMFLD
jgi:N-acetylglutamate synthase-like GNAT family acetyltransferase